MKPRLKTKSSIGFLVSLIFILLCFTSCSSLKSTSNQLILYNGQHLQTTQELVSKFEQLTGINVEIRTADEDTLVNQIEQEGKNSPADLIFTENSPSLEQLSNKGILYTLPASTFKNSTRKFDPRSKTWIAVTLRYSQIVYNKHLMSSNNLPTDILDFADKKYYGKIGLAPTETDFQPILTAVIKAYGYQTALNWLLKVKTNATNHIYPDNETLTSAVNSGQVAMGIINQYYWFRLKAQIGDAAMNSSLVSFKPYNPGNVIDVSGIGILKSSNHKSIALEFVKFITSREGQNIIESSDSFEYPVNSFVKQNPLLPKLSTYKPYPITVEELGNGEGAIRLLRQAQLI